MISSTSTTSTSGVMLISERTPEPPPLNAMSALPRRDLRAGLLVLRQDSHLREAGVIGGLHHHAHLAEVDALVGLERQRARLVLVVLRLHVLRHVLVGNPVLTDEDRAVGPDGDDEIPLLARLLLRMRSLGKEHVDALLEHGRDDHEDDE